MGFVLFFIIKENFRFKVLIKIELWRVKKEEMFVVGMLGIIIF